MKSLARLGDRQVPLVSRGASRAASGEDFGSMSTRLGEGTDNNR